MTGWERCVQRRDIKCAVLCDEGLCGVSRKDHNGLQLYVPPSPSKG